MWSTRDGERGPTPAGAILRWHSHVVCKRGQPPWAEASRERQVPTAVRGSPRGAARCCTSGSRATSAARSRSEPRSPSCAPPDFFQETAAGDVERFLRGHSDREPGDGSSIGYRLTLAAGSAAALLLGAPDLSSPRAGAGGEGANADGAPPGGGGRVSTRELRAGSTAKLVVSNKARGLTLQIFHAGPEHIATRSNSKMKGVPGDAQGRDRLDRGRRHVTVRIGDWSSGLYFARLKAADGRVGFAPFVLRPRRWASIASPSCCRR